MNLASLPMYALPALKEVTEAWWSGLAGHFEEAGLEDVPRRLTTPIDPVVHWRDPDLLFSQTCGYPLTHALAGTVRPLGTPCYTADGCRGPYYRSVCVVAASSTARDLADMRNARCAANDPASHSGYNILRAMVAPLAVGGRFFGDVLFSGSHRHSIEMIGAGEADIAAVDCVTHGLLEAHDAAVLADTRVLCMSPAAPALPFIAGGGVSDDGLKRLRAGLWAAFADPDLAELRAALLLGGVTALSRQSYSCMDKFERDAIDRGYPQLG